jgi:hypothetical protein
MNRTAKLRAAAHGVCGVVAWCGIVPAIAISPAPGALAGGDTFEAPTRIQAGGEYIDTDVGHAAPYLYDWNGDGVRDLLVGQFGEGKLRIYINGGSNDDPAYQTVEWFKTGDVFGTVPAS